MPNSEIISFKEAPKYGFALHVILPALGFLSYRCASWSLYHSEFQANTADVFLWARVAQIIAIVLLILLERKLRFTVALWARLVIAASLAMLIGALFVAVQSLAPASPNWLAVIGCLIHGAASACLFLGWGQFFCAASPRNSALAISLAFLLYSGFVLLAPTFSTATLSHHLGPHTSFVRSGPAGLFVGGQSRPI